MKSKKSKFYILITILALVVISGFVVYATKSQTDGINANGETYGIETENYLPDLILVEGDNGKEGYVKRTELDDASGANVKTREDAIKRMPNQDEPKKIDVYKKDGKTIIDKFTIDGYMTQEAISDNDIIIPISSNHRTVKSKDTVKKGYKYSYKFHASATFWNNHNGKGNTQIGQNGYKNVPKGYMGAQARLYTSSGSLKTSSKWDYNTSKINSMNVYTKEIYGGSKYYYSQGKVDIWNGNGYTRYNTKRTVNIKASSDREYEISNLMDSEEYALDVNNEYKTNEDGDTYGSGLAEEIVGEEPDYIAAVGTNGEEGYVKEDELNEAYLNPTKNANNSLEDGETEKSYINLYDKEGNKIGKFMLFTKVEELTDDEAIEEMIDSTEYQDV